MLEQKGLCSGNDHIPDDTPVYINNDIADDIPDVGNGINDDTDDNGDNNYNDNNNDGKDDDSTKNDNDDINDGLSFLGYLYHLAVILHYLFDIQSLNNCA